MPGPDRVPYRAWRRLGDVGIDALHDVACALMSPQGPSLLREAYVDTSGPGTHDFNLGILCCLPKKPTGVDDEVGEYFSPSSPRPLSIVNTDNRIIANAARLRWEPIFNTWVSNLQRGFLKGRSMLSNVVDVDTEAMTVSLRDEEGALVLFDFAAAFPSMSHDYLRAVLRHLGLPDELLHLVDALYDANRCVISCKGGVHDGFEVQAGIRQGCPLSPLLFAVTVDLLLRTLEKRLPGCLIRAFADDTAMVLRSFFSEAGEVMRIFRRFGAVSGLRLNLPKTVVIPLWRRSTDLVRADIARRVPDWAGVEVSDASRYLGFMTGPGKQHHSWEKAIEKCKDRACLWGSQSLGLQYAAKTYNVFAVSVMSFLAQLEELPPDVHDVEARVLRKVAPGPGFWASPQDLWYLKDCYGQTCNLHRLSTMALAAKVRVATYEPLSVSGMSLSGRARRLRADMASTTFFDRRAHWRGWYEGAAVFVLTSAVSTFARLGSPQALCNRP